MALCEYVGIAVHIEYLDGRAFDESAGLSKIALPETDQCQPQAFTPTVTLLYRPGHYDILYER
jgi:hypothetical protein